MEENEQLDDNGQSEKIINVDLEDGQRALKGMYEDWFLDYASYVSSNVQFLTLMTD